MLCESKSDICRLFFRVIVYGIIKRKAFCKYHEEQQKNTRKESKMKRKVTEM